MTVSVISVAARGEDDISVTLEIKDGERIQRQCFLLSATIFADLGIRLGECDRDTFDTICGAAEQYRAVKRGLSILGYGTCSEKMLCSKLVAKGFSKDLAKAAAAELSERGFLNDLENAHREAERCVAKLWGRRRIASHLMQRGYSDTAIKSAFYALEDSGVDFTQLCAERLRNSVNMIPADPVARQKLMAGLSRYGFSGAEIRDAMGSVNKNL